ncbi:GTPase HflX [Miniphocaeibacter halophilus]|uniref:GTPase HflX n=1 Tax=Miniphocaeibacter halophilus TaxID=2931922 RepID=A0AC61MSB0_9FIRM|nr:GTPase HflX [Miniphocaeibacter halophilus]QQK07500.1 GTPase HflX [Miniphocaeibacter halophilus]
MKEKIIAVTVKLPNTKIDYNNRINELKNLIIANKGEVVSEVVSSRKFIDSSLYIGKGKAEEIKFLAEELEADTIVFNNDLSGSQLKNLSDLIDKKIIDRTSLILDIFANRTRSKESKLQVQLAQMEYMLPRLVGFRKNLSKASAGIGTRGLGEQKLELDRRKISKEINRIKKKLEKIESTRIINSKNRVDSKIPIVSLVGYTNAGKSTIGNELTNFYKKEQSEVFAKKNMLFMTLDTTTRKGVLPSGLEFLIADTVGFIEDIPTNLIEAFKSTLEEIKYSDCILNIIDSSSENIEEQIETTYEILNSLEILDIPIINVFNKTDIKKEMVYNKDILLDNNIYISAYNKNDIEILLHEIEKTLEYKYVNINMDLSYDRKNQNIVRELKDKGYNLFVDYGEYINIKAKVLKSEKELFLKYFKE